MARKSRSEIKEAALRRAQGQLAALDKKVIAAQRAAEKARATLDGAEAKRALLVREIEWIEQRPVEEDVEPALI